MLVVTSKVKGVIKEAGFNSSADFVEQLDKQIREAIAKAITTAEAAKMKTVKGRHLLGEK